MSIPLESLPELCLKRNEIWCPCVFHPGAQKRNGINAGFLKEEKVFYLICQLAVIVFLNQTKV